MELFAGRYHLVDPIADGGMGSVWRAWDAKRGGYVAAKLLRPADAASLLRFVREQALRVVHPNVAAPHGWAAEDELVLLTMDLVGGGSVHQLIGDYGAIPVPYAAVLVDQLWSALTEVHAHGIVHRDVKPANVLLEVTGRGAPVARLADFGIAAVAGQPRLTEATEIVGTPGYLAPESYLDGQPRPGHDVYAAGVLAWRLLTGLTPPPEGPAVDAEAPPAGVPVEVWRAVAAFTAEPDRRPAGAAEAWRIWRAALSAAVVPAVDADRPDTVEVFDQLGPLPDGFGPDGPVRRDKRREASTGPGSPTGPARTDPPSSGATAQTSAAGPTWTDPPNGGAAGGAPSSEAATVAVPPVSPAPPVGPMAVPPSGAASGPGAAPSGPAPVPPAPTVPMPPVSPAQPLWPSGTGPGGVHPAGPASGAAGGNQPTAGARQPAGPTTPVGPHTTRPANHAATGARPPAQAVLGGPPVPTVPMSRDSRRRVAVGVALGATVFGAVVLAISLVLLLA